MTQLRPGRFEILPLVVKNLVIINALFFLAQNTFEATGLLRLEDVLGLHHVKSPLFQPWQLVTYLFLHGSLWHLAANMFGLWMFGSELENMWGPKRFVTFYFLCGIGAGLLQLGVVWYDHYQLINDFVQLKQHITPEQTLNFYNKYGLQHHPAGLSVLQNYLENPGDGGNMSAMVGFVSNLVNRVISSATIGASGAVFGIVAAFVYLFPNRELYFYFLIPVKAKWVGLLYFGYEVYSGILPTPGDDIAHWAHVGGGIVGFLIVLTWNKKNRRNFY